MKVLKFGGTSVGSADRMRDVVSLVSKRGKNIVVLSAMSGTTNSLLDIASSLSARDGMAVAKTKALKERYDDVIAALYDTEEYRQAAGQTIDSIFASLMKTVTADPSPRSEKEIVATGELLSTNMVHLKMLESGVRSVLLPALDFMRKDERGEPDMAYIENRLGDMIAANPDVEVYITQGFICRDSYGQTDNLERGGSDYTASLVGVAAHAEEVEIWTDIDGMHNNDPRYVEGTEPVHNLHFEEAAELAYFGAKILHPTCILPARKANIPVRLLNTMDPSAEGTLIDCNLRGNDIKAVAAKDGITAIKIKSSRMLLAYGFLKKVFEVFERHRTPIDMITTSEVGVSVTVDNDSELDAIVEELGCLGTVSVDPDMVIICVVGDLDWRNRGFEAAVLDALRDIPVRMISYGGSNYNISFLVRKEDKIHALRELSNTLFVKREEK